MKETQIVIQNAALARTARMIERLDGWVNAVTGFGTSRDRTTHGNYVTGEPLDEVELSALYHHNGLAKIVVEALPETALQRGVKVESESNDAELIVKTRLEKLGALEATKQASIWGRAFGGGAVLLGVDDGRAPTEPLDIRKAKSFDYLEVYDRRDMTVSQWDRDAAGQPLTYYLSGSFGSFGAVHRSRLILFGGAPTARREREMLGGWDYSSLQCCYETLKQVGSVYNGAHLMVTDASQGVFKMSGLMSAIAGGQWEDLLTRMRFVDTSRSVARSIMLDADRGEDFRKEQTTFAGIPDTMMQFLNKLSAESRIPVTVLMGQAPAGLNATGDSDLQIWFGRVENARTSIFLPALSRIVALIRAVDNIDEDVSVGLPPLYQPTPKEDAEIRLTVAQSDNLYVQNGTLTQEAVARNRFGGREWSADTRLTKEELEDFPDGLDEAAVYGKERAR